MPVQASARQSVHGHGLPPGAPPVTSVNVETALAWSSARRCCCTNQDATVEVPSAANPRMLRPTLTHFQ